MTIENTRRHRYSVYGVAINSDWPLAFPAPRDGAASLAAVDFVDGNEDDFSGVDVVAGPDGPWFQSQVLPDQSIYARWAGLYEFRIDAGGSRVACRALNGSGVTVLQNFLFGQALSFALLHQGLEPVHAGAVRVDDAAIAFLGDCTFGKSTMLASFLQAGHRLLTDDLLMVTVRDGQAMAAPGSGRIKLHPDSAQALFAGGAPGERLSPLTLKRSFPVDEMLTERTACPLERLYVLPTPDERKSATAISITPLSRASLFQELLKNTFNADVLTRDRLQRQFACAGQLAAATAGFRLRYPEGLRHLSLVRQHVLDHVRTEAARGERMQ